MDAIVTAAEDQTMNSGGVMIQSDVPPPLCSTYQRPDKETAIQEKLSRFARDNISEKELLCRLQIVKLTICFTFLYACI